VLLPQALALSEGGVLAWALALGQRLGPALALVLRQRVALRAAAREPEAQLLLLLL